MNDGEWTYTWEKGRRLKRMYKGEDGQPGSVLIDYLYNADDLRVSKQVQTYDTAGEPSMQRTDYTLHGKNIVHMTQGSNSLHFFYDAQNRPAIVEWNDGTVTAKHAYILNLQGDIVGIRDINGTEVVRYTYGAWGKPLSTTGLLSDTLGSLNPFRYRGYVYDEETGLYYLRSRYYNSKLARFTNSDSVLINKNNLFEY